MECNFTYKHFEETANLAKKLGFSFFAMHDFLAKKPRDKFIVMRHDIDLSLRHALKMAEFENKLGINSTYFIRIGKPVNPFFEENADIIRKIAELGHEIGIHYDSDIINNHNFKQFLLDKKKKLEKVSETKVFGISLHKIKKSDHKKQIEKLNFIEQFLRELDLEYDAYSDIFLEKIKYISESARCWREGCMCKHIKKNTKLCILTHPIWWSNNALSLVSIIEELL